MQDSHRHSWKPHLEEARAFISKRGSDIDRFDCVGKVLSCDCSLYLVVPFNKELRPVEATLEYGDKTEPHGA